MRDGAGKGEKRAGKNTHPSLQVLGMLPLLGTSEGFLGGREGSCQCRRCRSLGFDPWVRKIPWSRKWQPTPVFLPEDSMDRGAWRATVHGVAESDTAAHLDPMRPSLCHFPRPCHTSGGGGAHCSEAEAAARVWRVSQSSCCFPAGATGRINIR